MYTKYPALVFFYVDLQSFSFKNQETIVSANVNSFQVGGQVVEYYKQAARSLDSSNSKDHGERILDIVGNKQIKTWLTFLEFKVNFDNELRHSYY